MPNAATNIDHSCAPYTFDLDRWETEGGAIGSTTNERRGSPVPLPEDQAHVLQSLGAAVLSQWNTLPTRIQRELFEHSSDAIPPRGIARLKKRVARYLHEHKDDAGGSE
jgi:hypothetical protein